MTESGMRDAVRRVTYTNGMTQWVELGLDPTAAEIIGQCVATEVNLTGANVILCVENEEDAVLSHIVARNVGATRVILEEQEGLIGLSHALDSGSKVAFLSVSPNRLRPREVLRRFLQLHEAELVGMFTLASGGSDEDVVMVVAHGA